MTSRRARLARATLATAVLVAAAGSAVGADPVREVDRAPTPVELAQAPVQTDPSDDSTSEDDPSTAADPLAAEASESAAEGLQIASVSPWVEPDGEFQVRFEPAVGLPEDAQLSVTIHQSPSGDDDDSLREQISEILDGGSPGRILRALPSTPLVDLGDPAAGSVLTIPVRATRGDADRVLVPNPGMHPVELVLTRADGPEIWRQVVFLNRLPTPTAEETAEPVRVSLLLPVESGPAIGLDGAATFSVEEQAALGSIASLLDAVPDAPLTLGVRPNTLDGLARSEQSWATALLDALDTPVGGSVVLQMPYVDVDTGGLVESDATFDLQRQLVIGAGTVTDRIGRSADAAVWAFDDSVTPRALPVLADAGVDSLLVPAATLALNGEVDEETAMTRPLALDGGDGIRALAYDSEISQRLADSGIDAGTRAHQAVALMMSSWFEASDEREPTPRASAVLLTPAADPAVVASLQATLTGEGPLRASPTEGPLPASTADATPTVALEPRTPPSQRAAVLASAESRRQLVAYRSMTGDADPALELWDRLNDESLAPALDEGQRALLHDAIRGGIAAKVSMIEPPRSRGVVVTSEDTVIPLRFRNDLPYDVELVMRARSQRLDVADGAIPIVLAPGENRIDLPVTVQAPGESLLRIELSSPDGGIQIPGPDVPVRSTAISGVGAALSIVSILFLVVWWVHTIRRDRRRNASVAEADPSGDPPTGRLVEGG